MSFANPDDAALRALLQQVRTIAVVGLSPQPDRPSYRAARAMQGFGFRIVPARRGAREVLQEQAHASLADIPCAVDLFDVFRAAEQVPAIVDACLALHSPAPWIQEGVDAEAAAQRARDAGRTVVMGRCLYKDYVRLFSA
jgi:predicted CoA-binding protein